MTTTHAYTNDQRLPSRTWPPRRSRCPTSPSRTPLPSRTWRPTRTRRPSRSLVGPGRHADPYPSSDPVTRPEPHAVPDPYGYTSSPEPVAQDAADAPVPDWTGFSRPEPEPEPEPAMSGARLRAAARGRVDPASRLDRRGLSGGQFCAPPMPRRASV